MNSTAKQVGQSAKDLAQQIAKQIANQPGEILKDAKEQITGEELSSTGNSHAPEKSEDQKKIIEEQNRSNDQMKSSRRMEALQKEIEDIRKQDEFSALQKRISEGEEISLEEYTNLSPEQKQVLQAQMTAVKNQKQQLSYQESQNGIPGTTSIPSRRFGSNQKREAEKQTTRVEKPVPPSG